MALPERLPSAGSTRAAEGKESEKLVSNFANLQLVFASTNDVNCGLANPGDRAHVPV
jgi:hypothetical protein